MADKKVKISFETTANTAGAKQAEKGLESVNREAKSTERELDALEKQSGKLTTELARTGNTSEGVSQKMGGRLKGSIQSAGFQIQDFAVQVGGGTSAMTAFGQQAPQFLGAFGPAGSIAGAIIAIGAVAFNVFSKMGSDAETATENADTLATAIEQIAKNKVEELNEGFQETANALDLAARKAIALRTGIEDVIKSEGKLALARFDRRAQDRETATAEANAKLQKEGKPIDTRRVASDALARNLERQDEVNRQANQSEDGKVENARQIALAKTKELEAAREAQQKGLEELATERKKLETFLEQEAALKLIAKQRDVDPDSGVLFKTKAAKDAQKQLDDKNFRAPEILAQKQITNLEKQTDGPDSKLNKDVKDAEVAALAARTGLSNARIAATNNREANNLSAGVIRTDTVKAAKTQDQKALVGQLDTLVTGLGESGGKDLAPFITEMKSILQDKALSATELERVPVLLAQYTTQIQRLGAAQNAVLSEAKTRMDELEREIRSLKITASQRNP